MLPELRARFHEEAFFLKHLEREQVVARRPPSGADRDAEAFPRQKPAFGDFVHRFAVLAEELELVIAERGPQPLLEWGQGRRGGRGMSFIRREDETAPDALGSGPVRGRRSRARGFRNGVQRREEGEQKKDPGPTLYSRKQEPVHRFPFSPGM